MAWIVGVLAGGTALRGRSLAAVVAAGEILGKEIDDKRPAEVAATVKMIHNSMIGIIAFAVVVYWAGWVERGLSGPRTSLAAEA